LTGGDVILVLKIAVMAVTALLGSSLIALAQGNYRLHGRINTVFFMLTLTALASLEIIVRLVRPGIFSYLDERSRRALSVHLCFSLPAAVCLPVLLFTGWSGRRRVHLVMAAVFAILWTGTFVTGVFFLPTSP
jgi:hypothetical protein